MRATLVALTLFGCAPAAPPAAQGDAKPRAAQATVALEEVDRVGYFAKLAELKGRVVLVDFWATWCAPCLKQLPHTTALATERRDDGLAVLTVAMEDPDNAKGVAAALVSRGAAATMNLVSRDGGGSRAMEAFEIEGGALPHYKLYDRAGNLRRTFSLDPAAETQFTAKDVAAAVSELLAE